MIIELNKLHIKVFAMILLSLICRGNIIYAQKPHRIDTTENMTIYFRFDKADVERDYMSNDKVLKQLDIQLNKHSLFSQIDSIAITSFTSPEGNKGYNHQLGKRRAKAVKGFLVWKYPHLDQRIITTNYGGENWDGLRKMVELDSQIPNKDDVLWILGFEPDSNKEVSLRQINNGKSWNYIEHNFLRFLRTGATCIISYKHTPAVDSIKYEVVIETEINDLATDTLRYDEPKKYFENTPSINTVIKSKPLFSIKTNLLADALTSINIAIEIPIRERWSVEAEWMFPWWIFNNNKYYNQLLMGTLEGRYWLRTKRQTEVLSGHAIGLYVSAGYYDFQWEKKGYQGEIIPSVGLSYTYAHLIGKHFRMEYSLGVGILNTKYRQYTANDNYDQFPWLKNGSTLWFGPTKTEISLVWVIGKKYNRR